MELIGIQDDKIKKISDAVRAKDNLKIAGLPGSSLAFVVALFEVKLDSDLVIISADSYRAEELYEDFLRILPENKVHYYPEKDIFPHEDITIPVWQKGRRLQVLNAARRNAGNVFIIPISAAISALTPLWRWEEYTRTLNLNEEYNLDELGSFLVEAGYSREDMVENEGQFSVRGGILDVYPPGVDNPFRIEFFGDEIDSLRTFSVDSQKSIEKLKEVELYPATEFILPDDLENRGNSIAGVIKKRIEKLKHKNKTEMTNEYSAQLAQLEEALLNENKVKLRRYLPFLYNRLATIFDYFNEDAVYLIEDRARSEKVLRQAYEEVSDIFTDLLGKGEVLPYYFDNFWAPEHLSSRLYSQPYLEIVEEYGPEDVLDVVFQSQGVESYHSRLPAMRQELRKLIQKGYRVVITVSTEKKRGRLADYLSNLKNVSTISRIKINEPGLSIIVGNLKSGFKFKDLKVACYTEKEIFGQKKRKKLKLEDLESGEKIKSFSDLKEGDYVVHENHGIGVFKGIKTLEVQNKVQDYLLLEYAEDDKLYVPPEQIDLVQKYIGGEAYQPRLYRLGGSEWQKTKEKVKASVKELAIDLIDLYAARETVTGYAFSQDTVWQQEFEDDFPYEETPDQKRAITEVKADMESPHPMDRLLCGDVGYGKTEVAIRAAFKAAIDGKQTAVLVPTTILAQQHFNTFLERIADFPITVAMLSRFKSRAEQKVIMQQLASGKIDIVIGTHRLLSKDIKFNDLGLLVIDEEQRFGVGHKEKLKDLKKKIDVLTMTATPIPRTLHMALSGVRDMSIIETPPENRYPVRTYVKEYDRALIRDAIRRELARDGQAYFVHNRVKDIDKYAQIIRDEVPEAKVAVAHGQMAENKLERIMYDFYNQKFDVLVCTTIIENGLDIPNVNTIIVNRAENFGLAQLYQIRGRVGRTDKIAYSYMLYEKDKILPEVANKRLQAIKEFTSLGSGFKIAMRDMEIRGTGNLLGAEQHGHIASIGYSLYCKLLDKAVNELRGKKKEEPVDVEMKLDIEAYIPDEYMPSSSQKIEFYQRIKNAYSDEEVDDLLEEMIDRFGDPPPEALNLLAVNRLKAKAAQLYIIEILEKEQKIRFTFKDKMAVDGEAVMALINHYPRQIQVKSREQPILNLKKSGKFVKNRKLIYSLVDFLDHLLSLQESSETVEARDG
ncbi:MAG: transcription-repair coupling factor [Bacillota bacterium]